MQQKIWSVLGNVSQAQHEEWQCVHLRLLSQIMSSEAFWLFFQTVIASWKGNRVSGYYFPILQAEKLKQEERRKKKSRGRIQNSWPDSASPILAPLLPPLRRAAGAVCLCSAGLLGAFRWHRCMHQREIPSVLSNPPRLWLEVWGGFRRGQSRHEGDQHVTDSFS